LCQVIVWVAQEGNLLFSIGDRDMEWTTPGHEEIELNCEISSYANAEL
jgi:hypothetical protein